VRRVSPLDVTIARTDRGRFGLRVEDRYYARHICVTGKIEADGGGARILASRPDQLKIENGFGPAELHPASDAYRPCDDGVVPSRTVRDIQPDYTSKKEGQVKLEGGIGTDGSVRNIRVLNSVDPVELDVAAVQAFSQWQFTSPTRYGKPVPVITTAYMTFALSRR
jgi:TonB family protein